jgi:membrane fusion protein (multidrug efflux system)
MSSFQKFLKILNDNRKRYVTISLIGTVCIIVLLKILGGFEQRHPPMLKIIETEIVKRSSITDEIGLIGTIKPKNYCVLIAKAAGTIDTLVQAGTIMKKGDIIAKIENPDIEKTYELCATAEKIANSQYERVKTLAKSGASSKGALEDKERSLIDASKALASAKMELDNITIKAPFDGVLGVYKIKDGEQVTSGGQLVSFYNPSEILVEFDIPGEFISKIKPKQKVTIVGKKYKLTHAQKAIDEDKHMCPAYVELKNDDSFVIGSSVDIRLSVEEHDDVVVIPYSSICIRNGKDSVFVSKDGKAILKEVVTGIKNKDKIEIAEGLEEGEEVIIVGQDRLFNGVNVKTSQELSKQKNG